MEQALLIASDHIDKCLTERVINALREIKNPIMFAIADDDLRAFDMSGLRLALLIGDFDTVETEILARYLDCSNIEVQRYNPVRDNSDFALAIGASVEKGCAEIHVLGVLGGRTNRSLVNMRLRCAYEKRGVSLYSLDEQNHIRCVLATERRFSLQRDRQQGEYLGFFLTGGTVEIKSPRDVYYPPIDFSLSDETTPTLAVSNEISTDNTELELPGDSMTGFPLIKSCDREESKWIRS